jgi:hypothetical protein
LPRKEKVMETNYVTPEITTLDASGQSNGEPVPMGTWAYSETVAVVYGYALLLVVVTQIDVTP